MHLNSFLRSVKDPLSICVGLIMHQKHLEIPHHEQDSKYLRVVKNTDSQRFQRLNTLNTDTQIPVFQVLNLRCLSVYVQGVRPLKSLKTTQELRDVTPYNLNSDPKCLRLKPWGTQSPREVQRFHTLNTHAKIPHTQTLGHGYIKSSETSYSGH